MGRGGPGTKRRPLLSVPLTPAFPTVAALKLDLKNLPTFIFNYTSKHDFIVSLLEIQSVHVIIKASIS